MADFVAEVGIQSDRGGWCDFLKPPVATCSIERVAYALLYGRPRRLGNTRGGRWWWPGNQLGKPTKVLRDRCQRELELGTAWPAQSQAVEPQDTLQMCKQHLDTLAVAA